MDRAVKRRGDSTLTSTEPILALLEKPLAGRAWRVAVVAFAIYYLGSAVAAWFAGTLYSQSTVSSGAAIPYVSALVRFLAFVEPPSSGNFVSLSSDFAHFNFSVLTCLVALPLGYAFMRRIPEEFRMYFGSSTADCSEFLARLRSRLALRLNAALAVGFALLAGSTFVWLARSDGAEAVRWWGNSRFGGAGYYLAFGQAVFCYYAMWGFIFLLILNRSIRDAAAATTVFHPFHHDGYHGFQPLARLIAWQAGLILIVGTALFSTFYMGYFGLEQLPLTYLSMVAFLAVTGAALASPLWDLTKQVRKLRTEAISDIGPRIHSMALQIRRGKLNQQDTQTLAIMMDLHDAMKSAQTLPFSVAALNGVIFGYGLQAAVLIRQFYAHHR
jgi:hypothetical protein